MRFEVANDTKCSTEICDAIIPAGDEGHWCEECQEICCLECGETHQIDMHETQVEKAAREAKSGDPRDLTKYLKTRRNFI